VGQREGSKSARIAVKVRGDGRNGEGVGNEYSAPWECEKKLVEAGGKLKKKRRREKKKIGL